MAFGEEVAVGEWGFGAFLDHAPGEMAGGLEEGDIIHQGEGLKGGVGDALADVTDFPTGTIKDELARWRDGAFPVGIHALAVKIRAGGWLVAGAGVRGDRLPKPGGLVGFDRGTAEFWIEEAGGVEGHVADGEAVHTVAWAAGEEAVFGVALVEDGIAFRGLLEGVAGDKEAIHLFDIPTGVHEFDGEPVEEIGVAGDFALEAEIFGGFDQTDGEEVLPHTVDGDPGGDWIIARDEPAGEAKAILGVFGTGGEESGDDPTFKWFVFDWFVVLASIENVRRGGVPAFFPHDHDGNGASGGRCDFFLNRGLLSNGVAKDRVDAAMVVGEDFGIGGFLKLGENVGGDSSGFGGGILCFGGEDAEGSDLVAGGVKVEMEVNREFAGVGRDGLFKDEEEAFGFVGVAVDGPPGGIVRVRGVGGGVFWLGVGGDGRGNVDRFLFGGNFDVGEDEISVCGEGEFVCSFQRGVGEGVDANAGEGALAGWEAEFVGRIVGPAFEEPGIVEELFKFPFGGFGGGEIDGKPVAFQGVFIVVFDPVLKSGGEGVFSSGDFFRGRL